MCRFKYLTMSIAAPLNCFYVVLETVSFISLGLFIRPYMWFSLTLMEDPMKKSKENI